MLSIQSFHHICIQTSDYAASLDFYVHALGFKVLKETPQFHSRAYNTWLEGHGIKIELQTAKAATSLNDWSNLNSGPVHICFMVASVQAAYQHFKSKGYTHFKTKAGQAVYEVKGSPLLKIKAPEGTEIEIRQTEIEA